MSEAPAAIEETAYIDLTNYGRNGIFSWIFGFILILGLFFVGVVMVVVLEAIVLMVFSVEEPFDAMTDTGTLTGYFNLLASFPPIIAALWVVQKKWHKRAWRHLMTGAPKFRWKLLFVSGVIYFFLLAALFAVLWPFADAGEFRWVYNADTYWGFLAITLLLVPFQAASEEMVLRGYLGQWFARYLKPKWLVYVLTSALFAALHLANPETESGIVLYMIAIFTFGLIACALTHKTNGLEAAIGVHIFNNIFVFSGVSYDLPDTASSYLISLGAYAPTIGETILELAFQVAAVILILKVCKPLYSEPETGGLTPSTTVARRASSDTSERVEDKMD